MGNVFKDSKKSEVEIEREAISNAKSVVVPAKDKIDFVALKVYALTYPHGFRSTYQGVPINIIFDGSTYKLSPVIARYVQKKLDMKTDAEQNKLNRNKNPKAFINKLGDFQGE